MSEPDQIELDKVLAETESDLQKIVDLQNPLPRAAVREAVAEQLAKIKARRAALNHRGLPAREADGAVREALEACHEYFEKRSSVRWSDPLRAQVRDALALPAWEAEAVPLAIELYEVQRRLSFMEKKYGKIDWEGVITS